MNKKQKERNVCKSDETNKRESIAAGQSAEALTNGNFFKRKNISILLFVFWVPLFLCCLPGNILWDTVASMSQFLKIKYVNPNNPYFLNFFFGSIAYVGMLLGNINIAVMIFCLLQSFMTIFLLSDSICWIGSRSRIAGYILLFFYGLVPVFPIFSMTMAKDSCLAVAVLLNVSMAVRSFGQHDFWLNDRNVTLFSLSILLMTLFRNHAGWVPAMAFVLYAVFALKQKKMIIKSAFVFMLVGFFAVFLPAVLKIPPTETKENMAVPLQTMAYYAKTHPEEMTDEDKTIISQVIPYEEMISRYDPNISDPIKNIAKFDTDSTGPFIRLWFQKLFRHPGTMASGFYRGIYIYLAPEGYCTIKPHAKIGYDGAQGTKDALGLKNENPNLSTLMKYLDGWLNTPVIHLFVKIGVFSILLGFCLFLIIIFKQGRYMFCIAPLLMVLIGCFLSPVNGYYRYAYSMIIGIPIVFADILVTIGQKAKEKGFHLFVKKGGKSHVSMEK